MALPVLETEEGGVIKESMVILQYLEDPSRFSDLSDWLSSLDTPATLERRRKTKPKLPSSRRERSYR